VADDDDDVEREEEAAADGRIFRRRIVRGARFGFAASCVAAIAAAASVAEALPSTPAAVSSLNEGGDCPGDFIVFDDIEWFIPCH
jgi:hypothetical protein